MKLSKFQLVTLQILSHAMPLFFLLWLLIAIPQGRLGGDPVPELIHYLGKGALHLLLATLCITPIAKLVKIGQLMRLRRPLGLWCFAWASCHFAAWISFDLGFAWAFIGEEIISRNYILLGVAAWILLFALTVTSLPKLMRRMGRRWKQLHSLIYVVGIMVLIHYWWSLKSGWIEPALYFCGFLVLLWFRRGKLARIFR